MNIIQKLPDDIIVHIYTKILRKYRLHEGKFIKLIDFEKYKDRRIEYPVKVLFKRFYSS